MVTLRAEWKGPAQTGHTGCQDRHPEGPPPHGSCRREALDTCRRAQMSRTSVPTRSWPSALGDSRPRPWHHQRLLGHRPPAGGSAAVAASCVQPGPYRAASRAVPKASASVPGFHGLPHWHKDTPGPQPGPAPQALSQTLLRQLLLLPSRACDSGPGGITWRCFIHESFHINAPRRVCAKNTSNRRPPTRLRWFNEFYLLDKSVNVVMEKNKCSSSPRFNPVTGREGRFPGWGRRLAVASLLELPLLAAHGAVLLHLLRVEPLEDAVHVEAVRALAPHQRAVIAGHLACRREGGRSSESPRARGKLGAGCAQGGQSPLCPVSQQGQEPE